MAKITAAHIRALADADYGQHLPVLSRDEFGDLRVEPESTAKTCWRTVVTDATAIQDWSDGQPMTEADCGQYAAEIRAQLAERDDA